MAVVEASTWGYAEQPVSLRLVRIFGRPGNPVLKTEGEPVVKGIW
jgi:hypothetical protein